MAAVLLQLNSMRELSEPVNHVSFSNPAYCTASRAPSRNSSARTERGKIFCAYKSVDFAHSGFGSGNEIWALDGARAPLVLRKTGHKKLRIVSECYLWAALELDHWNPGTGKGRVHEKKSAPYAIQTHIIEIH
jgi:hypothetical protein